MTSNGGCKLGYQDKYIDYFEHFGLDTESLINSTGSTFRYSKLKESINRNHPVIFGEPGHIMVAVGYLDFPDEYKTEITVDIENRDGDIIGQIDAKKDFILVVNDPKRNRNRSAGSYYFGADGNNSSYLIVSHINAKNEKDEYMCRSGRKNLDSDYICIKEGTTALSVFN